MVKCILRTLASEADPSPACMLMLDYELSHTPVRASSPSIRLLAEQGHHQHAKVMKASRPLVGFR